MQRRCSARGTTSRLCLVSSARPTRPMRAFSVLQSLVAPASTFSGTAASEVTATQTAIGESLELFTSAYEAQARGANAGDSTLIDQGTLELDAGAAVLGQVTNARSACTGGAHGVVASTELAVPAETSLKIFVRLAASILATGWSHVWGCRTAVCVVGCDQGRRIMVPRRHHRQRARYRPGHLDPRRRLLRQLTSNHTLQAITPSCGAGPLSESPSSGVRANQQHSLSWR